MRRALPLLLAFLLVVPMGVGAPGAERPAAPHALPPGLRPTVAFGLQDPHAPAAPDDAPEGYLYDHFVASDLDADGVRDFVDLAHGNAGDFAQASRGADGQPLWTTSVADVASTSDRRASLLSELPDVDGDGMADVLVSRVAYEADALLGRVYPWYWVIPAHHAVLSGRTGATLWTLDEANAPGHVPLGSPVAGFADANADGRPDVVTLQFSALANQGEMVERVVVREGASGVPLREETHVLALDEGERVTSIADVSGDGQPDLVMLAAGALLVAKDGPTGRTLWTRALSPVDGGFGFDARADVDGDGDADVIYQTAAPDGSFVYQIRALDGRTGRDLWTSVPLVGYQWPLFIPSPSGASRFLVIQFDQFGDYWGEAALEGATGALLGQRRDAYPEAVFDLTGDGEPDVIAWTQQGREVEDLAGGLVGVRSLPDEGGFCGDGSDLDGDGFPDAVWLTLQGDWWLGEPVALRVTLLSGRDLSTPWTRAYADYVFGECPAPVGANLATVLVTNPEPGTYRYALVALDAKTGATAFERPLAVYHPST